MLVSVVVGARVLAAADRSQSVWVATRDLPAGATLTEGDLARSRVRLFDNGERYLAADGDAPLGYVLTRAVGADELLPREGLLLPEQVGEPLRDVSVPVDPRRLPADLRSGELVDVYLTPGDRTQDAPPSAEPSEGAAREQAGTTGRTRLLLSRVPVTLRPRDAVATGEGEAVVLRVTQEQALRLVQALQGGSVDLSRVPLDVGLPALPSPVRAG